MNEYECSKQSIAEQILDDFEDILTTTLYQTLKQREKMDSNGNGFIHFTGRIVAYDDLIDILPELRKKYGVD